jgi:hypothetical protein
VAKRSFAQLMRSTAHEVRQGTHLTLFQCLK